MPKIPDSHPSPIDWDELDRYLAGESTPGQAAALDARLDRDPALRATLERVIAVASGAAEASPDLHASWPRLRARLAGNAAAATSPSPAARPDHRRVTAMPRWTRPAIRWGGAAAVAAMLIAVSVTFTRFARSAAQRTSSAHVYTTAPGQRASVTLADGSRVTLAPATTVTAARTDAGWSVRVSGQALFTVAHHAHVPFLVRTTAAATQVLGTTFLVRQYADESSARVVVMDGRVSVVSGRAFASTPRPIVLDARMGAVIGDSGRVVVTPSIETDAYTAWTDGRLVFRQAPVQEIVAELSRAYGAQLELADSTLGARALTWTVPTTRLTLTDALDALTTAIGAHVVRSGDTLTIVPGPALSSHPLRTKTPYALEHQYGK